jgi:hypothetical protein
MGENKMKDGETKFIACSKYKNQAKKQVDVSQQCR